MLKKEIIESIKKMNEVINERFRVLSEYLTKKGEDTEFLDTQRKKFKLLTNTKSEKRIATGNLSRFNKTRLEDIERASKQFLYSEWSTISGRERIKQKRLETFRQRGYDLTETQYNTFIKVMNNKMFQELMAANNYDSEQVLDNIMTYNLKSDDLLNTLNTLEQEINLNKLTNLSGAEIRDLIEDMLTKRTEQDKNGNEVLAYTISDAFNKVKK